ncbi:DUF418 domain-containing protein [Longimycelium tulufanense]|uniref:DUF418 domain-containing protein n=1 Tax=Longimycelium tulufanense TaxID=907463 RepID=UPI001E44ED5E|nr:DUF418 domain-containing protein [Longimycelium tulufanense]
MAETTQFAPRPARTEGEQRIVLLDVLRGVAILGTLGTNIWIFTEPGGLLAAITRLEDDVSVVEAVLRFLANGKFLGMLTILFGVGLEIQRASATRRGKRWPGRYLWRMALLFADGVLHYVLVVEFDILMGYAVTGIVVSYLVLTSERAQRRWMIAAGAVHVLLVTAVTFLLATASAEDPGGPPITIYTDGSYLDQIRFRFEHMAAFRAEPIYTIPMAVCLFLLGTRLYRAGAFGADERGRAIRRRLMIYGLGIGVPLNLATALSGNFALGFVDRYLLPPLVALGCIGLLGWLIERVRQGWVTASLASMGRMALSCYMMQNILASVLCYGWGLGLAAKLVDIRALWTPLAWLAIALVLLVFSRLWLARFRQGPFEAVWRWAVESPRRRRPARPN